MGGRDRAVHPATGTAHGRGTHRGRVAGRRWARHAGVPSPDASPGLAGVPLDARARSVPAAGLGCRAVRHRPAREPWGTVLRPHRRHARAPCIGQGAGSGRALRPCPQAEPSRLPAVPGLCHAGHRRGLSRSAALRADRHRPVPRSWPRREDRVGQGLAAGRGRSPRTAVPAAGRLVYARLADPGGPAARARRRRPGPARHGAVRPAAAPRSGPAWPPRVYGERIDAAAAALLPAATHRIAGYGGRAARLRHAVCRPRFLRGVVARAVWCELAKPQGGWAKQRLLLCTDLDLSAPAVVEAYAQRWAVEPLFAALKLTDGMGAMWQRGRRTLLRWLHLVQIGRALLVLLTARAEPEVLALLRVGGWRRPATLTPGLVKDALARRLRDIQAFRLVPATHKKTGPARGTGPPVIATAA